MATLCARSRFRVCTLVSVLAFAAIGNMGCAEQSIAARYPHLDRRAVCVLPPEVEQDSTEFVITDNNVPISNFHPEVVDRLAPTARTVFEYDPGADPSSVRYLPAPYNELTCPKRFSILPSKDAETPPLPEASVDLLVHEPRPEIIPQAVAEKLASCTSQSAVAPRKPVPHTVSFNVYVTNDGQAVSAAVAQSTLGDRKTEACMLNALRTTLWPADATPVKATSVQAGASTVSPVSKLFFAQPAPILQPPDVGDRPSGIYPKQAPQGEPGGFPKTYTGRIPLPVPVVGGVVFLMVFLWEESETAPAWNDELNPVTGQSYVSREQYEIVRRMSPAEIRAAQQAHIKATQPQAPPASAPPPAPAPQAQPTTTGNRDRWQCSASCNVQQINPKIVCPARVTGSAGGPNEPAACVEAKRSATQSTPAGCYPRHCQCRCSRR